MGEQPSGLGHSGPAQFQRSLDLLGEAGLRSAWHRLHGKPRGDEGCGTFFSYRHEHRRYHIDRCFVSSDVDVLLAEIGAPESWLALSDHCPLTVELRRRTA